MKWLASCTATPASRGGAPLPASALWVRSSRPLGSAPSVGIGAIIIDTWFPYVPICSSVRTDTGIIATSGVVGQLVVLVERAPRRARAEATTTSLTVAPVDVLDRLDVGQRQRDEREPPVRRHASVEAGVRRPLARASTTPPLRDPPPPVMASAAATPAPRPATWRTASRRGSGPRRAAPAAPAGLAGETPPRRARASPGRRVAGRRRPCAGGAGRSRPQGCEVQDRGHDLRARDPVDCGVVDLGDHPMWPPLTPCTRYSSHSGLARSSGRERSARPVRRAGRRRPGAGSASSRTWKSRSKSLSSAQ